MLARASTGRSRLDRPAIPLCVLALAILPGGRGARADDGLTVRPREAWSGVFGAAPIDFHFEIRGAERPRLRVGWAFTIGRRTVAAGEAVVDPGPDGPVTAVVHLDVPPVKDGVVLPALLTVTVAGEGRRDAPATVEKPLRIFPRNPFADRALWLEGLGITLFDPAGTTAGAFEAAGIPFVAARDIDGVADLKGGTLVVGEGVSLAEQPGLAGAMAALAARGVAVLCLAPKDGSLPDLAAVGGDALAAGSIALRRRDVIAELDKRLDHEGWPGGDGEVVASGLALKAEGDRLACTVLAGDRGWPWLEVGYAGRRTKLVVCGFGVMKHWDDGPTPRFLLTRALEVVAGTGEPADQPDPEEKAKR